MSLIPIEDKVVLKPVQEEDVTTSGIVLSNTKQEKPKKATVIAVGNGLVGGKKIDIQVKENDAVIYSSFAGDEIEHNGEQYLIVKHSDILAIVR